MRGALSGARPTVASYGEVAWMDRTFEGTHPRAYARKVRTGDKMIDPRIPVKKANPNDHQQATYIADRIPRFKVHRTLGHAHAAISWKAHGRKIWTDMALYTKVEDEWVLQHEWKRGERVDHFPWQAVPPTEEELRDIHRREDWGRIQRQITAFVMHLPKDQIGPAARMVMHFLTDMNKLLK